MSKVLKKYTTIPDHLYVKRNADKQLKRIIDDMERPGYVLVARQMGKTNMLLHAIRSYSDESHLFTYVDLSTSFSDERECYRNIVDNILEPNEALFGVIYNKIYSDRIQSVLPPHTEYIKELRQILATFKGNIIIILDEIDALRSVHYSDHIFAQIRSNYFARTNFPEFGRLTYVLSGVIEPTDLIKDKNKSPFNIGDKIYLDDFSKAEHEEFIKMAELQISQDISDYIFSWTSGNPRLTFDICSDVEDIISEQGHVTTDSIKNHIKSKYFTLYDIPPVDHIRDIVSKNKQIRNAVRTIQKGNPITSVETKRRLYLYGIIGAELDNDTISIKNRIIKESLSLDWLDSVDKQNQDLYTLGLEKIDSMEYREAIELLEEYLSNSEVPAKNREISTYNLGYAYFKLSDYETALKLFDKPYTISQYKYESKLFTGNCQMALGNKDTAISLFKEIVENTSEGFAHNNALMALATHYYKEKQFDEAILLFEQLINELKEDDHPENRTLKLLGYAGAIQVLIENKNLPKALDYADLALEFAGPGEKLELNFTKYLLSETRDQALLISIAREIIDKNLRFATGEVYDVSFSEFNNYRYLLELYVSKSFEVFNELLLHTANVLMGGRMTANQIIYHIATNNSNKPTTVAMLTDILNSGEALNADFELKIYRSLLVFSTDSDKALPRIIDNYLERFKDSTVALNSSDISAFTYAIKFYSDRQQFDTALNIGKAIESRLTNLSDKLTYESLIIFYWMAFAYFSKKDNRTAIRYANMTLDIIGKYSRSTDSILDVKAVNSISEQMNQIISSTAQQIPVIRSSKKYGRNERVKVKYQDGTVKEGKYKIFEADILTERCFVLT